MKHLIAGLIVSGGWLLTLFVATLIWSLLSTAVDGRIAAAIVGSTLLVGAIVVIVDWLSERKKP